MAETEKKTRQPSQKRAIETRDRILDSAAEMIAGKGFFRTNSKEIAKNAGVSIGTFYAYFSDKKELLKELFDRTFSTIEENFFTPDIYAELSQSNMSGLVSTLVDALYNAHRQYPDFHREALSLIYTDKEIRELNSRREQIIADRIHGILQSRKEELRISDLRTGSFLIYRSSEEIIHNLLLFPGDVQKEDALRELKDMIFRYLI